MRFKAAKKRKFVAKKMSPYELLEVDKECSTEELKTQFLK